MCGNGNIYNMHQWRVTVVISMYLYMHSCDAMNTSTGGQNNHGKNSVSLIIKQQANNTQLFHAPSAHRCLRKDDADRINNIQIIKTEHCWGGRMTYKGPGAGLGVEGGRGGGATSVDN